MKALQRIDSNIIIIKLSKNFGSHAAIFAGLCNCSGDCAIIKAADLQEPSELILEMHSKWKSGNRVVLAVRKNRKDSFWTKFFAGVYYWLVRKTSFPSMPKGGFDCYLIDRKVINVLRQLDETNSALTLQILWAGFKTAMIYYTREDRKSGRSRWTFVKKVKLAIDSLIGFSFIPIRIITCFGALFFIFSVVWSIFLLVNKIFDNIPVQGWATMTIVILFSSGMIMLALGIFGEYLWRTLDASRNRPVYIIEEDIKNGNK
jgi:dolichol-phosphate mannosyltransferase